MQVPAYDDDILVCCVLVFHAVTRASINDDVLDEAFQTSHVGVHPGFSQGGGVIFFSIMASRVRKINLA